MKERARQIKKLICRREVVGPLLIAAGGVFFVWFMVFGDQGLYQLHKSYKIKAEMRRQIEDLNKKIGDLKKERELLKDPDHLESIVRQELGYVKPGEIVFQQINR